MFSYAEEQGGSELKCIWKLVDELKEEREEMERDRKGRRKR